MTEASFEEGSATREILADFFLTEIAKNSGVRSELKRCRSASEVMMTSAFYRLHRRLGQRFETHPRMAVRLATVLGLMAHLKLQSTSVLKAPTGSETSIGLLIKPMTEGARPRVSELRFRRLLQRDLDDLYVALVRVLRMLDGNANLFGVAESVLNWGDTVKRKWAAAYFSNVPAKQRN